MGYAHWLFLLQFIMSDNIKPHRRCCLWMAREGERESERARLFVVDVAWLEWRSAALRQIKDPCIWLGLDRAPPFHTTREPPTSSHLVDIGSRNWSRSIKFREMLPLHRSPSLSKPRLNFIVISMATQRNFYLCFPMVWCLWAACLGDRRCCGPHLPFPGYLIFTVFCPLNFQHDKILQVTSKRSFGNKWLQIPGSPLPHRISSPTSALLSHIE